MRKNLLSAFILLSSTFTATAGSMGPVSVDNNQLLIEGGFYYKHTFLKNFTPLESITTAFPNGVTLDAADYYPDNFYGGYIGVSFYTHRWLLNSRYVMLSEESKTNAFQDTTISIAPSALEFTVDRVVWGDINQLSLGLGGGAAITNVNKGSFIAGPLSEPGAETSQTLDGQGTRIDPVVEAFVMQRVTNNLNVKFNAEYVIPYQDSRSNGALNLALGLNYAADI